MNKTDFENAIRTIAENKPILLDLDVDKKANKEMLSEVEKHFEVTLSDDYKEFLNQYGGGYFGFVVVYSCDKNGMFYIKNNVLKKWVFEKSFLPVIDLETGDFIGFEIENGRCKRTVSMYSHEEGTMHELQMTFYDALLKYGLKYGVL